MSFEPTGFSQTIFKQRYALTPEETWVEACERLSRQNVIAENPERQKFYFEKFRDILSENLFVPGGRIWYNSGRVNPQLLNCFLLGCKDLDSKEGWGRLAKEMIVTSMTGGGCGIDFSDVRPNGATVVGNGGSCPGPVSLMELINGCGFPVRAGGSRRVALMFSLDLTHPDISEFLDAKLSKGKLQLANVSVRSKCTTDFIKAVKNNEDIVLDWKNQYKKTINAKDLWQTIVTNAYNSAEPGFLNFELINKENTIWYSTEMEGVNPCGEVTLSSYENCCLGHLVLSRFVSDRGIEWSLLADTVRLAVRYLDNILTLNHFPLPEMKEQSSKYRRIGLGVTALADMLILLGYKYGSEEANKFVDKLFHFISKQAYESSIMLAIEKGPFPACDPEKHLESGYVKRLPHKIRSLLREHGIRNCAILTVAPTGTVSILSGNCSSGIEPLFASAYERRYFKGDKREVELVLHPLFKRYMEEKRDVNSFVSSRDLSVREHLEVQKIVQKHVDNAISKTINIPEDYPIEELEKAWMEYLPYLKGTTFYRENSRGYVDENGVTHEPPLRALDLDEAMFRFDETELTGSEVDCSSGVCEL